jgi:hypothetical protein
VETTNLKAPNRGSSPNLVLTERFRRTSRDAMEYQMTFTDPATWTAPWTAALDMKSTLPACSSTRATKATRHEQHAVRRAGARTNGAMTTAA